MTETLEQWMLNTSVVRLATGSFDHDRVMFIAQSRCLVRGKRQTVTRHPTKPTVWRIADEGL
jgi:hypothetical protein